MEAYVRGLVADGMWGPMERRWLGQLPSFWLDSLSAWKVSPAMQIQDKEGEDEKILACKVWGLLEQGSEDAVTDF